ncbi:hypothetical protein G7Z17_g11742 [Cylindrodendrum hubeiense]|uniref:Uncharacterized protein n=1 Tax=Cylindrodendrum hubeiense TaxID=595255 RepID=A0A9P5H075_9HYPO|nr:hypothetical protein G7Z17_g11742 [Cylindrodendrum hubeiense]
MDQLSPQFIQNIVIQDIIENDNMEIAALATVLALVQSQQKPDETEGSDDYDSEYDSLEEGSEYEDEPESAPAPAHAQAQAQAPAPVPVVGLQPATRKRSHSQLRDEAPCAVPKAAPLPQPRKRVCADSPSGVVPSSTPVVAPRLMMAERREPQPPLTPDQVMRQIDYKAPGAWDLATAIADVGRRFTLNATAQHLGIVCSRLRSSPQDVRHYNELNNQEKDNLLWRWINIERLIADSKKGEETLRALQEKVNNMGKDKRAVVPVRSQPGIETRLKAALVKRIDAKPQGKLEDRVRRWLDDIIVS